MYIVILFTFINKLQLQYTVTNTQDFGNKIRESHPTDLGQLSLTSVKKFLNEPFQKKVTLPSGRDISKETSHQA